MERAMRRSEVVMVVGESAVKSGVASCGLIIWSRLAIAKEFFPCSRRPAHERNPRSGESVAIPEKRVPHFKPGKALRESVDQRTAELQAQPKG